MPYADAHLLRRQNNAYPTTARTPRQSRDDERFHLVSSGGRSTASRDPLYSARQEWSGRIVDRTTSRERTTPCCWICGKQCTAYGWCQANSCLVHRITFYPASLFTLCATCAKALSLAPGTSLVDVVQRCNPTSYTRQHSHAFVNFVREYLVTLEAIYLDMEEEFAEGSLSSNYAGSLKRTPRRSTTVTDGPIRRDQVQLTTTAINSLMRCIGDALADREALTLKEVHLMMKEGAALEVQLDDVHRPHHSTPTRLPPPRLRFEPADLSPEQRFVRAHPLLADPPEEVAEWPRGQQGSDRYTTPALEHPPSAAAKARSIVRNEDESHHRSEVRPDDEPVSPREEEPIRPIQRLASGTTARLLEAAEEWAAREQEFLHKERNWGKERSALQKSLVAAQNEARILRERVAATERDNEALLLRNADLTERLAALDSATAVKTHFRYLTNITRTLSTAAAECASQKANLFCDACIGIVRQGTATARHLRQVKEELEHAKMYVRQQQKMLETSRRAIMNAWSEKAEITGDRGGPATISSLGIGSLAHRQQADATRFPASPPMPAPGFVDDSEETTLF